MCVAIVTNPGKSLTSAQLEAGWRINGDGGGFAYVKDNEVVIEKGFMNLVSFEKAYQSAVKLYGEESPFLVHMRIRTSGTTNSNNCHPFRIRGGALIHNGVMFTPAGNRAGQNPQDLKSDTRIFAESLHNILELEHVKKASEGIRKAIGYGNKVCFLYDNKEVVILGEAAGFWDDGIWYSNTSCGVSRPPRT